MQSYTQPDVLYNTETHRHIETHKDRDRETDTHSQTQPNKLIWTQADTLPYRYRELYAPTDRHRERHTLTQRAREIESNR